MSAFRPGEVDYAQQAAGYAKARALSPPTQEAWREAIERWLRPLNPTVALDLGSGTGRFSPLLAECLECNVIGVEPSDAMRESAIRDAAHPSVQYKAGDAENIPLEDASCDAAWLGYMIHHVPDLARCGRELARVLRPGALVLVAGVYGQKRRELSLFRYFPSALEIVEGFPLETDISAAFVPAGLEYLANDQVIIESAPSLAVAAERLAIRADTTLRLISDEDFAAGLQALREAAARESEPRPIIDSIDLLVYRRP